MWIYSWSIGNSNRAIAEFCRWPVKLHFSLPRASSHAKNTISMWDREGGRRQRLGNVLCWSSFTDGLGSLKCVLTFIVFSSFLFWGAKTVLQYLRVFGFCPCFCSFFQDLNNSLVSLLQRTASSPDHQLTMSAVEEAGLDAYDIGFVRQFGELHGVEVTAQSGLCPCINCSWLWEFRLRYVSEDMNVTSLWFSSAIICYALCKFTIKVYFLHTEYIMMLFHVCFSFQFHPSSSVSNVAGSVVLHWH